METIKQIVYNIRDASKWCGGNIGDRPATDTDWEMLRDWLRNFAGGIEAAHAELLKKIQQLEDENARLKAALKPVLEFQPYDVWPNEEAMLHRAFAVTEESKRIYNEKEESK